jgi:oligoribonuclease NrnB/cAMP/cGMP phosphodiesterase (DHH superfamily)
MKIAIIYHDADFDGKLSNEVCRYHLAHLYPLATIDSYGWDYGRPLPTFKDSVLSWTDYDIIYIVDLSVDEIMALPELRKKIIWIDHHKSAIEKWDSVKDESGNYLFAGSRIDGVAACRLCWQWFTWGQLPKGVLPSKQDFIEPLAKQLFVDRKVSEPRLIRLAGEYDIWDHRDPAGKALQFGLRTLDEKALRTACEEQFNDSSVAESLLSSYIEIGNSIKSYCDKQADEYSGAFSHTINWEGLKFCALNIGQRGSSDLLRGGIKEEHDACFAWRYDGKMASVSLYHVHGKNHLDLSLIAVKYGGGGHKGACGLKLTLQKLAEILAN